MRLSKEATLGNLGLGAQSASATNFDTISVREMLVEDLKRIVNCSFERYLHYMLSLVGATTVPKESAPTEAQVGKDLEDLATQMARAMNADDQRMKAVIVALGQFCGERTQKERYPHFVNAFNEALQLTQPLTFGNAKPSPEPGEPDFLMFMNHHHSNKQSEHKEKDYSRKPDTEAVFRDAVLKAYRMPIPPPHKSISQNCFKELLKSVQETPQNETPVPWSESLSSQEHTIGGARLSPPPSFNEDYEHYLAYLAKAKHARSGSQSQKRVGSDVPTESQQSGPRDLAQQITEYAAEAMYNCFGRDHIMNMTIQGDMLHVWYFDHESPIRTTGLNFVQNLPYLLLFLFALQRFQPAHFGFIPDLQPTNANQPVDVTAGWDNQAWERAQPVQSDESTTDGLSEPQANVTFLRDGSVNKRVYCLNGRATWVIGGQVCRGGDRTTLAAMKLSYQEKSRSREVAFLKEAHMRLETKSFADARQYLPVFGVTREFFDFSTDNIRRTLGVAIKDKAARIPCIVVMPRYLPITYRTTDWGEFLNDFFKLIYCHAALWCVEIEHGDISVSNLMWDPKTQTPKLCDFDLAHFTNHPHPTGFVNTGTWIFMAQELLTVDAMEGKVKRLYRHDVESFLAVLVYVMSRYEAGKELPKPPLGQWYQMDYLGVSAQRKTTYQHILHNDKPRAVPGPLWLPTVRTARAFLDFTATYEPLTRLVEDGIALDQQQKDNLEQLEGLTFIKMLLSKAPLFKLQPGAFDLEGSLKKILQSTARKQLPLGLSLLLALVFWVISRVSSLSRRTGLTLL